MKNFNLKGLLFISSLILFSGKAMAVRAPVDAQGHALATIDFVGAFPCTINAGNQSVLTASPIVCTQGSSTTVTPSLVYGIVTSSISQSAYLVFRDTIPSIANNNNLTALTASTVTVVYNYNVQISTTGTLGTGENVIKFPVPIQFKNGISVNVDSVFSGPVSHWTILYRPIDSSTVGN